MIAPAAWTARDGVLPSAAKNLRVEPVAVGQREEGRAAQLSTSFLREHDAVLVVQPFNIIAAEATMTAAHGERLSAAVQRGFVRSLRLVDESGLLRTLLACCTDELGFRLSTHLGSYVDAQPGVLVTCAARAHLALGIFLERDALFTAEVIGRVTRRI